MALDVEPLSPQRDGDIRRDESPPVTDFATQVAQQASERLTELDARSTSIAGQIEALRLEGDQIQREKAEAQRILDAALGTTNALQLARKADEPQGAEDEAPAAEAEAPSPDWTGAPWPATEPQPEPPEEQPVWTGGQWTTDERTTAIMDDAARSWMSEREDPLAPFAVNDVKNALNVTRPTASGILTRLQEAGDIAETDEGRAFLPRRPEAEADETDNEVTVEPESRSKPTGTVRSGNQVVTVEMTRDAIREHFGVGTKFNGVQLGEKMGGVSSITLRRYIRELYDNGTLVRHGGKSGPGVKYEMVKPDPRSGPRVHPRHDGPRQLPKGTNGDRAAGRGKAVAHTGRPVGRSGRPGRDKKKANLGFRVKDKK